MKRTQNSIVPSRDDGPSGQPYPAGKYALIAIPVLLLTWVLFKIGYPFADFFTDSYTYINAAANHDSISFRPIGYSIFLRGVHSISASDTFLTTLQYLLLQSACLYLFFFLHRQFNFSLRTERILLAFLLLDPVIPYLANCVSSDALFTALSLFWMVELIRLVRQPSRGALIRQLLFLALVFLVRYNALCYPVVAAFAFLLCPKRGLFKLTGIAASILIVLSGTLIIKEITRRETGVAAFSAFSSWQLANNALNMYPWIPVDTTNLPSPEGRQLTALCRQYFDSAGPSIQKNPPSATSSYMWEQGSPLRQYMDEYRKRYNLPYFTAWNNVSPLFTQYGYHLIRRHPLAFSGYYLWPSAKGYFLPPLEIFEQYNEGKKEVDAVAQDWFHYHTRQIKVGSPTIQAAIFAPFPWIYFMTNVVFVITASLFLWRKDRRTRNPGFTSCFILIVVFFVINSAFGIFATASVFRYQVVSLILLVTFIICALSKIRPSQDTNDGFAG
jgi:hypothetical protein